jgi:hypothetical protein
MGKNQGIAGISHVCLPFLFNLVFEQVQLARRQNATDCERFTAQGMLLSTYLAAFPFLLPPTLPLLPL